MNLFVLINLIFFVLGILFFVWMQRRHFSFTVRVFSALGLGILFGAILQIIYGAGSEVINSSIQWINIVGTGYIRLLNMIVIPLVMVSIITAIINLKDGKMLGKMSGYIIGILIITAGIAALVGIFTASSFGLTAEGLQSGEAELQRGIYLEQQLQNLSQVPLTQRLVEIIPANPFLDMTGARPTSTLAVVIFSSFVGIATLGVAKKKPESAQVFINFMNSVHDIVMKIVTLVLRLTPFGIFALMTRTIAQNSWQSILRLGEFVLASYVAIGIMFIIHLVIIALSGLNPFTYLKKALPTLTFAFTSRTSAGTIPLTVKTQVEDLGIPEGIANLAASFGASIGQNGCAAIYPAMVAFMIAPTVGINPLDPLFIISLVAVIIISSFGVAGVGGGATFASLIVLSTLGLPVGLVGLLISVEPLIDMARTALNVNDSILSGLLTSKLLKTHDIEKFKKEKISIEDMQG